MTDKEIELLFKSIDNFDEFLEKISLHDNIKLKNDVEVSFNNQSDDIEVCLPYKRVRLTNSTFQKIIRDLLHEEAWQEDSDRAYEKNATKEQRRKEIIHLGDNRYKVSKEYIEHMFGASDTATAHGDYIQKLLALTGLFNQNIILTINEKKITTKGGLLRFLKAYGFENVYEDLKFNEKIPKMTLPEREDKVKRIITEFEDGKLSAGEALSAINNLTGKSTDDYELLNYWRSEDLDTFARRLAVEQIEDWQTIDDKRAIALLTEIFEVWTSKPEIVDRNCEALERRYRKSTGTVHEKIIVDNITDSHLLLEELKKETRIFL